ncbi:MAG: hypothetical protein ACOY31_10185 [Bacillota bacterium]
MKRFFAVTILVLLIFLPAVAAASAGQAGFSVYSAEDSVGKTIVKNQKGLALVQTWYGQNFYLDTRSSGYGKFNHKVYQEALEEISFPLEGLEDYKVYTLPYQLADNKNVLAYTFQDNSTVVFAGDRNYTDREIHWLAAHEAGHAVDFKYMDSEKWEEYKVLRGITDSKKYNNNAPHKDQPREIFAEDFRMLFGGDLAVSIPHENDSLPSPSAVKGLKEFFLSLA